MSLLDLFHPKRRHSQPEVRVSAVGQLLDLWSLIEMSTGDPDPNVRAACLRRLVQLAKTCDDSRLQISCIAAISDVTVLWDIAHNDANKAVRRAAHYRLHKLDGTSPNGQYSIDKMQDMFKDVYYPGHKPN